MKGKKKIGIVVTVLCLLLSVQAFGMKASAAPKLNKKKATIYVGDKVKLKVTGTTKKVTWKSSDPTIASVTKSGKVTGKRAGKAVITAKAGKKKLKCNVKVLHVIKAEPQKVTVKEKGSVTVQITFRKDGEVAYQVKDASVATALFEGGWKNDAVALRIYGQKKGTTTVTISNNKCKETVDIMVTVE